MFESWGNRFIEALEVDDDGNITDVIMWGEKMNYIPEIAKMLGVEIGEEFKILPLNGIFRLTENGLSSKHEDDGQWYASNYLTPLLTGQYALEKLPFEPKDGEYYYAVYRHTHGDMKIGSVCWCSCWSDYVQKYCGNCFRTREEAEAHKYEIYKKLTGREWEE